MNRAFQIIGILIIILGCDSKKSQLQNKWIGKYSVSQPNSNNELIYTNLGSRNILDIRRDSLIVKEFRFDIYTDSNNNSNKAISIKYNFEKKIILMYESGGDTVNCNFSKDSLALEYIQHQNYFKKFVFQKLPKYNLSSKESELNDFLLSSTFEIFDSIRIEFKDDSRLITPNFDFDFDLGDNKNWMLDKYEEELFLVVDGFSGFLLQIKEINFNGFTGIIYGKENKEILFKKSPKQTNFEVDDLIGNWIEYWDKRIPRPPPPLPPPISDEERESFGREQLLITDSTIQSSFLSVGMMKWETNREQDLILLSGLDLRMGDTKWKIISLSEEELIIERIWREWGVTGNKIKRKVFERK